MKCPLKKQPNKTTSAKDRETWWGLIASSESGGGGCTGKVKKQFRRGDDWRETAVKLEIKSQGEIKEKIRKKRGGGGGNN